MDLKERGSRMMYFWMHNISTNRGIKSISININRKILRIHFYFGDLGNYESFNKIKFLYFWQNLTIFRYLQLKLQNHKTILIYFFNISVIWIHFEKKKIPNAKHKYTFNNFFSFLLLFYTIGVAIFSTRKSFITFIYARNMQWI